MHIETEREEVIRLTGHYPSKPYNHLRNTEIQQNIVDIAAEARSQHLSYGQLQARKYQRQFKRSVI